MKKSISFKMSVIVIVIMTVSLGIAALLSGIFLEKYYTNKKQKEIISMYEKVIEIQNRDIAFEYSENVMILDNMCEKTGASMIIVDNRTSSVYQFGNANNLWKAYQSYLFDDTFSDEEKTEVIEEKSNYILMSIVDKASSNQYYQIWGRTNYGSTVLLRMSVESIRESLSIANGFYLTLGIAIILIVTISILIITRRFTKPVLELAHISKKVSELDFDAKYTGKSKDEIGILGESINEMSDKLESTISDLKRANIELHKDIAKKEEVDEMRKEFISNVSHELKTPIALIQGYAEGLQDGMAENDEDREYYCSVIVDEANKMNRMVKNLLSLNQLEFGKVNLSMERFDIGQVVNGVIQSMKPKFEEARATLELSCPQKIHVWADEFQIEEVITNYLSNAINHLDENKLIKVEIIEKNGIVRVSVFNTGKQIPKEELEKIWIKFYKVDKARTREYGGNGIGLSIVKAIMDRHNKAYGVINHSDGVEFWFELDADNMQG